MFDVHIFIFLNVYGKRARKREENEMEGDKGDRCRVERECGRREGREREQRVSEYGATLFIYLFIYYRTRTICTKAYIVQQYKNLKKINRVTSTVHPDIPMDPRYIPAAYKSRYWPTI